MNRSSVWTYNTESESVPNVVVAWAWTKPSKSKKWFLIPTIEGYQFIYTSNAFPTMLNYCWHPYQSHLSIYSDKEHSCCEDCSGYRWPLPAQPTTYQQCVICDHCHTHPMCILPDSLHCSELNTKVNSGTQNCQAASPSHPRCGFQTRRIHFHSTFVKVFYGGATKPRGAVVWKDLSLLIEY